MKPPSTAPAIPSSAVMMKPPGSFPGINSFAMMPTTRPNTIQPSTPNIRTPLRQSQNLSRLDHVGIGQLVLVEIEDLHVVRRVPQVLLGDTAQRVARFHRVGLALRCRLRRPAAG